MKETSLFVCMYFPLIIKPNRILLWISPPFDFKYTYPIEANFLSNLKKSTSEHSVWLYSLTLIIIVVKPRWNFKGKYLKILCSDLRPSYTLHNWRLCIVEYCLGMFKYIKDWTQHMSNMLGRSVGQPDIQFCSSFSLSSDTCLSHKWIRRISSQTIALYIFPLTHTHIRCMARIY